MNIRVRFAPSPTGFLHVGGLRTALYNYLFARHHGGVMVLRIEDTDRSRYVENAVENLICSLKWAGVDFDEGPGAGGRFGPYFQSERLDIYQKYTKILLDSGKAYYAFDSPEEIERARASQQAGGKDARYDRLSMRNQFTAGEAATRELLLSGAPYVVRLDVPTEADVQFNDVIRGEIHVNSREIDDQVLMKSDGFPTYHLANVVDDHLMEISHVIRGEEWLPSTPKHILLYQAFGWEPPQFAHLPLLLNKDRTKLSKRHASVAVEDFRAGGYDSDAFVNFIALLGFNPSADREIYTIDELIAAFNLEKVNKGGAMFDLAKLAWINAWYLRNNPPEKYAAALNEILTGAGYPEFDLSYLAKVILLLRERVEFLKELPAFAPYMFAAPAEYEEEYLEKCWTGEAKSLLPALAGVLAQVEDFSHEILHEQAKIFVVSRQTKLKVIIHPLRLMITGKSAGAGMFETMEVLGKQECIARIRKFLEIYG